MYKNVNPDNQVKHSSGQNHASVCASAPEAGLRRARLQPASRQSRLPNAWLRVSPVCNPVPTPSPGCLTGLSDPTCLQGVRSLPPTACTYPPGSRSSWLLLSSKLGMIVTLTSSLHWIHPSSPSNYFSPPPYQVLYFYYLSVYHLFLTSMPPHEGSKFQ